jgi:hypothetical protein
MAPDGVTNLSTLNLFTKAEFLAPGKTIRVFVDSVRSYFARRQPNLVSVSITWKQGAKTLATQISHDVRIYKDLPYVTGRGPDAQRGAAVPNRPIQRRR